MILRTDDTERLYKEHKASMAVDKCPICNANSLKDYEFWRVINNDFPYDVIAREHHMLVPKRHVLDQDLNSEEWAEILKIKQELNSKYDYLMEGSERNQSVPEHFHLHLVVIK